MTRLVVRMAAALAVTACMVSLSAADGLKEVLLSNFAADLGYPRRRQAGATC
jgi:hypothetical protein